jgi:hypothetical protein
VEQVSEDLAAALGAYTEPGAKQPGLVLMPSSDPRRRLRHALEIRRHHPRLRGRLRDFLTFCAQREVSPAARDG